MIQVSLWAPECVFVEEWEEKIINSLNNFSNTFPALDVGQLKVYTRNYIFNAEQLAPILNEALFIPIVQQLHIIILTDYNIIPLDHLRVIDHLIFLDSVARSTRRIQILVFDLLTSGSSTLKIPLELIKAGIKVISLVPNSAIQSADAESWAHDAEFRNCEGCNTTIFQSLTSSLKALLPNNLL